MTKKEFAYWKIHKDKILKTNYLILSFHTPVTINRVNILRDSDFNTPNPNIVYTTDCYYKTFGTVCYKIIDILFENTKIIIKIQRNHNYFDEKGVKQVLVGKPITNTFYRKYIKDLFLI